MNYEYALPPSVDISKMNNLKGLWEAAGLKAIETKIIKVDRKFNDFEEFWEITSNSASIKSVLSDMNNEELTELKAGVRQQLPVSVDGSIQYSSWANAIQGVVA